MSDHQEQLEVLDAQLDHLFARAQVLTLADEGAAGRFLTRHRARQRQARHLRAGWLSALVASAAVVVGFAVLQPTPEAPASAAYGVYESAWGEGW